MCVELPEARLLEVFFGRTVLTVLVLISGLVTEGKRTCVCSALL
ncbi:MAG: hypothetical protein ACTTJ8_02370 [Treponema sp.]